MDEDARLVELESDAANEDSDGGLRELESDVADEDSEHGEEEDEGEGRDMKLHVVHRNLLMSVLQCSQRDHRE